MSRARSAREGVFAVAGPDWQEFRASIGRHIPRTELLRRLVPVLLIAFTCIACAGFAFQMVQGKRAALDAARQHLALLADNASLNLKDTTLGSRESWQAALAGSPGVGLIAGGEEGSIGGA